MTSMTSSTVSAVRVFATFECGSRVTRPVAEVATRAGHLLNCGMVHCQGICTGIDQLSICLDLCLFVDGMLL